MRIYLGIVLLIGTACLPPLSYAADQSSQQEDKCGYGSNTGEEIIFGEMSSGGKYGQFYPEPDSMKSALDYADFVGKRAKVGDKPVLGDDNIAFFRKVITADCQTIFLQTGLLDSSDNPLENPFQPLSQLASMAHFILVSDLSAAQKLIGHTVWMKRPSSSMASFPDESPFLSVSLRNLDSVKVVQVDTKNYGVGGETPIKLLIETTRKEQGLINYGADYIYPENPIKKSWHKGVIEAIKAHRVSVGMSEDQARLSWGQPQHINTSVNAANKEEQWVYGNGDYLYFTNGMLTSVQTND